MTLRASLYARLSKAADDTNMSLEGMIKEQRELCSRMGLTVVAVHKDDGISGGKRDRPGFEAWLADAAELRCDVLMTYAVDRLSREGLNSAARILDAVEGKDSTTGQVVRRPTRLLDTTGIDSEHGDAFRFRYLIAAEVARSERERMRARNRANQQRLLRAGRVRGSTPPYGYKTVPADDGKGKTYAIEPAEAKFIREALQRVLAGDPLGRVVRWANHSGVKPRRAAEWTRVTLRQVLCGQAVLGRVSSRGEVLRDEEGQPLAPFPAVLSLEEHAAVNETLTVKKRDPSKMPKKHAHLLSGLLVCHSCGKPLHAVSRSKGEKIYRCATRSAGGVCEGATACSLPAVEAALTDLYLSRYGDERMYRTRVITEGSTRLAQINEDIAAVMVELAQTASPEAFSRLQRLQKQRAEAEAHPPTRRTLREPTGGSVREWWESAHLDDRRDAIRNVWGTLTLHPGVPGRKGFDLSRLTFEHSAEEE